MNPSSSSMNIATLKAELELMKQHRKQTDHYIANQANEKGEQSPFNVDESFPFQEASKEPVSPSDAVSVDSLTDEQLKGRVGDNKVVLWRCQRDYFQPNVKLLHQYHFDDVVIEEAKDCYIVYSNDVSKGIKTLFDNFDFDIAGFGQAKPDSVNEEYLEEIFFQAILRRFDIFPSLLFHEREIQRSSCKSALKRLNETIQKAEGMNKEAFISCFKSWYERSEKGLRLST